MKKKRLAVIASPSPALPKGLTLAQYECKDCSNRTVTASIAGFSPFCSHCGGETAAMDKKVPEKAARILLKDEKDLSVAKCHECGTNNILADTAIAALDGHLGCVGCGADIEFAMQYHNETAMDEGDMNFSESTDDNDDDWNADESTTDDGKMSGDEPEGDEDKGGDKEVDESGKNCSTAEGDDADNSSDDSSDDSEAPKDEESTTDMDEPVNTELSEKTDGVSSDATDEERKAVPVQEKNTEAASETDGVSSDSADEERAPVPVQEKDKDGEPTQPDQKGGEPAEKTEMASDDGEDEEEDSDDDESDKEESSFSATEVSVIDLVESATDEAPMTFNVTPSAIHAFMGDSHVATLRKTGETANAELFGSEQYMKSIVASVQENGIRPALNDFGFELSSVKLDDRILASFVAADADAKQEAAIASAVDSNNAVMKQSLEIAAAGLNRNYFKGKVHGIKNRLFTDLSAMGVKNVAALIDKAFAETEDEHNATLLDIAYDLSTKSDDLRNELSDAMENVNPLAKATTLEEANVEKAALTESLSNPIVPIQPHAQVEQETAAIAGRGKVHSITAARQKGRMFK